MEIRELRYFLAVAREESITHAAEILHVTQPTLSRQIFNLEEELGVQLFNRSNRNTTLTDKGLLLYQFATEIIELVEKAERDIKEDETLSGEIVIGSAISSSAQIFAKLLHSFSEKYPLVHFDLVTGTRDQIKEKMDQGLIDIGLLMGYVGSNRYHSIKIGPVDRFGLLMQRTSPLAKKTAVTLQDFSNISLTIPKSNTNYLLIDWYGADIEKLHIYATHDLLNNAATLVEEGICYALTLEAAAINYKNDKLCFRPLTPEFVCESFLVWRNHKNFSLTVSKFIEHIENFFITNNNE